MANQLAHDSQVVLVVDFGAQYAQLIARRVREAQVYSEIVPHKITAQEVLKRKPIAIILSGGPASVHVEGAPVLDPQIYELGIPILGICYGAQLIAEQLGGKVSRGGRGEYGRTVVQRITGAESQYSCPDQCVDESLRRGDGFAEWFCGNSEHTRCANGRNRKPFSENLGSAVSPRSRTHRTWSVNHRAVFASTCWSETRLDDVVNSFGSSCCYPRTGWFRTSDLCK